MYSISPHPCFCLSILSPGLNLFLFSPCSFFPLFFFRVYLRAFALFSLHLPPWFFSPWSRRSRFRHVPCSGLSLRRAALLVSVLDWMFFCDVFSLVPLRVCSNYSYTFLRFRGVGPVFVYKREFAYPMEASTSPLSVQHTRAAVIVPLSFHCHGIEDQPPHLTVIDPAPRGKGCGSICRGGRVICEQFSLLSVGGGTLLESDGPGVWVGTPVPSDCSPSDGRPSAVRPRVSPPRGLIARSREGKKTFRDFLLINYYIYKYA